MVGEHSKNELKIGSDQAREINLVLGMAPGREASCPNHKLGSGVGWCQCSNLPAGAQSLPLLLGRSQAKPLGKIPRVKIGHWAWHVLPRAIVIEDEDRDWESY